jgi:hypothetical protein
MCTEIRRLKRQGRRSRLIVVFLTPIVVTLASAQESDLERTLRRLHEYLDAYEQRLSEVVAEEIYEQRVSRPGPRRRVEMDATGLPIAESTRPPTIEITERRLQSTVSFMRLPGGEAWLGMRTVRMLDGRKLDDGESLLKILQESAGDLHVQANALVQATARHHLGKSRSVNMPTLPLELLDRRHRERLTFRLGGDASVRGVPTTRIQFTEKGPPTIIRGERDDRWVISRGVAWIDTASGALWRAQVYYRDYEPVRAAAPEGELLVEFDRNAALDLLVPERMREVFLVDSGRGEGEARYSNYRRFSTSARVRPPG